MKSSSNTLISDIMNAWRPVFFIVRFLLFISPVAICAQGALRTEQLVIDFRSEAPLELITAQSMEGAGVVDTSAMTFAFRVRIRSFEGFNSPLQKEHFNENYMESERYPLAIFKGRFLESKLHEGVHLVRGSLQIHGKAVDRVIEVDISQDPSGYELDSRFQVLLADHDIEIPQVVFRKIAERIDVQLQGKLR